MSEAEEFNSVRVSSEGVRVLKRFAADEFPVPAIAFELSSGRDEPVTVKLSDPVPDSVDVEDLGFHPDYGSEHWTIEEDRITFEREIEPDASYTTVYGIRAVDDIEQFLTDPTIEVVDPPLPETSGNEEPALGSDDALVEDAIAAGAVSEGSDESKEMTETEVDVPSTLDLGDPSGETTGATPGDVSNGTADDSTAATAATAALENGATAPSGAGGGHHVDEDSLVAALATELRENDIPQEDLAALREVLVVESGRVGAGSTVARLNQLQEDITELRAYTNALEEFLDENGTGTQLIESFEEELESFEERIDHLETEFDVEVRDRLDDLEVTFETLESDVAAELDRLDSIESDLERLDSIESDLERLDSIESDLERLDDLESDLERLDDLESDLERLDSIESDLERLDSIESDLERLDDLESDLERLDSIESDLERLDDLESDLERLDSIESDLERLDSIESDLERLDSIESDLERLDDLESDLESIQKWKEQLIKTLGGG